MNKKETLSITQKYTIQYVINGCLWLLYSISNLISLKPVKIIGAVILRFIFIFLGVAIINTFHWILYIFGFFLFFSGLKIL